MESLRWSLRLNCAFIHPNPNSHLLQTETRQTEPEYSGEDIQLPTCGNYRQCPLRSDQHHASKMRHVATAFLLLNLLNPWFASQSMAASTNRTFLDDSSHVWSCGAETDAKKVLQSVITNSSTKLSKLSFLLKYNNTSKAAKTRSNSYKQPLLKTSSMFRI
jgi:hypothetical protein